MSRDLGKVHSRRQQLLATQHLRSPRVTNRPWTKLPCTTFRRWRRITNTMPRALRLEMSPDIRPLTKAKNSLFQVKTTLICTNTSRWTDTLSATKTRSIWSHTLSKGYRSSWEGSIGSPFLEHTATWSTMERATTRPCRQMMMKAPIRAGLIQITRWYKRTSKEHSAMRPSSSSRRTRTRSGACWEPLCVVILYKVTSSQWIISWVGWSWSCKKKRPSGCLRW